MENNNNNKNIHYRDVIVTASVCGVLFGVYNLFNAPINRLREDFIKVESRVSQIENEALKRIEIRLTNLETNQREFREVQLVHKEISIKNGEEIKKMQEILDKKK